MNFFERQLHAVVALACVSLSSLFFIACSENETEGKHFSLKNDLYVSPDFSWSAIGNKHSSVQRHF